MMDNQFLAQVAGLRRLAAQESSATPPEALAEVTKMDSATTHLRQALEIWALSMPSGQASHSEILAKEMQQATDRFVSLHKTKTLMERTIQTLTAFDRFPELTRRIETQVSTVLSSPQPPTEVLESLREDIRLYQSILDTIGEQYCGHLKHNLQSIFSMLFNNLSDFVVRNGVKNPAGVETASAVLRLLSTDLKSSFALKSKEHFSRFTANETGQVGIRAKSLKTFSQSFNAGDSDQPLNYTFLFAETATSVLDELAGILKSESKLGVFGGSAEDQQARTDFHRHLQTQTMNFLGEIFSQLKTFFEFDFDSFLASTKEMYILIDHPYQRAKKEGVADKFDIPKLQVFINEVSLIVRAVSHVPLPQEFPDLEVWTVEQKHFLKSVVEIVSKLQLIIAVRESKFLQLVFFSPQEAQCLADIEREILRGSFSRLNFGKHAATAKQRVVYSDFNFSRATDWVFSVFELLEAMCADVFSLEDPKSIIPFLSFAFNALMSKDIKNLLGKLAELSVKKELFRPEGFHLEAAPKALTDVSLLGELLKEVVEKQGQKKPRLFSRHNLMFVSLLEMYQAVLHCVEKLKQALRTMVAKFGLQGSTVDSTVDDLDLVHREFAGRRLGLLREYVDRATDNWSRRHFEKLRGFNLAVAKFSEATILDDLVAELGSIFSLYEVYFDESTATTFRELVVGRVLGSFKETLFAKTYNLQGSAVMKGEYEKLKTFALETCGDLEGLRDLNMLTELVAAIDKDYFDNFASMVRDSLPAKEVADLKAARIDFL